MSDWQPGVTTVLKQLDKSGAFWAAASRIVAEAAVRNHEFVGDMIDREGDIPAIDWLKATTRQKSEKAMDLGTRIHAFAEDYAKGQQHTFADDAAPYIAQYLSGFLERYHPTMEHIEEMVYSERGRYGGTFDVICLMSAQDCPAEHDSLGLDSCRWLIDYKTSNKKVGMGVTQFPYPDTGIQLAALAWADFIGGEGLDRSDDHKYRWTGDETQKHPIPSIDHFGVVAITPDDCRLIQYDVTEADYQTFLHLRNIHEWVQTRRKEIKVR